MGRITTLLCLAGSIFFLAAGCAPSEDTSADPDIGNSFKVAKPTGKADTIGLNKTNILLEKKALGKEFILQANLVEQLTVPMFGGIESRIVIFKQSADGQLQMLDAPADYAIDHGNDLSRLLATFPIVSEDAETVLFDFNSGMTRLFLASDFYASDMSGGFGQPILSLKVDKSYIDTATIEDNHLVIKQVASIPLDFVGTPMTYPFSMVYYLSPYAPNPSFEPMSSTEEFTSVGFFEVSPKMTPGAFVPITRVAKWDSKKPIVFALSSNTPAEYRESIADGIRYWNTVMGSEFVRVIDAPADLSAPSLKYNIIQWVDNPLLGFAYADAQMDPRSGEILHAQIFLPSSWAVQGQNQARYMLRKLEDQQEALLTGKAKQNNGLIFKLKGFETSYQRMFGPQQLMGMLTQVTQNRSSDDTVRLVAKYMLREVVAHEVGHTLGLRHNFAGSLGANLSGEEMWQQVKKILTGKASQIPAGIVPSSSIMDYLNNDASLLTGYLIAKQAPGLPHDVKAMNILYRGAAIVPAEIPLFCTDSQTIGGFNDCSAYDNGRSVLEASIYRKDYILAVLPTWLLELYIAGKSPDAGMPATPVEKVSLNFNYVLSETMQPLFDLFKRFTTQARTVKIQRQFPLVDELNAAEVLQADHDDFAKEVEARGGVAAVLAVLPPDYPAQAIIRFEKLLEANSTAVGNNGMAVTFSAAEKATMKAAVKNFFKMFETKVLESEMNLLSLGPSPMEAVLSDLGIPPEIMAMILGGGNTKIDDFPLASELATYVAKRVDQVLFAETGETIEADVTVSVMPELPPGVPVPPDMPPPMPKHVSLPVYKFPRAARVTAIKILASTPKVNKYWGKKESKDVQQKFTETMQTLIGGTVQEPWNLPQKVQQWLQEKEEIEKAIMMSSFEF